MSDNEIDMNLIGEGKKKKRRRIRKKLIKRPLRLMHDKNGRFVKIKGRKGYIKSKKSNAELIREIMKKPVYTPTAFSDSSSTKELQFLKQLQDENFKEALLKNKKDDLQSVEKKLEEINTLKQGIQEAKQLIQDRDIDEQTLNKIKETELNLRGETIDLEQKITDMLNLLNTKKPISTSEPTKPLPKPPTKYPGFKPPVPPSTPLKSATAPPKKPEEIDYVQESFKKEMQQQDDNLKKKKQKLAEEKKQLEEKIKNTPVRKSTREKKEPDRYGYSAPRSKEEVEETDNTINELENIGLGKTSEDNLGKDALYNYEIEKIMKPYKDKGFQGVIANDEIKDLVPKDKMSWIMNTSKRNEPGEHWTAVNIDVNKDKAIEYYDPYGEEPGEQFFKDINWLVQKLKPETYLKLKVNSIKEQDERTSTCGFHCIKFLINRYRGHPFKECSGYSDVRKNEKEAQDMAKKYKKFGYI